MPSGRGRGRASTPRYFRSAQIKQIQLLLLPPRVPPARARDLPRSPLRPAQLPAPPPVSPLLKLSGAWSSRTRRSHALCVPSSPSFLRSPFTRLTMPASSALASRLSPLSPPRIATAAPARAPRRGGARSALGARARRPRGRGTVERRALAAAQERGSGAGQGLIIVPISAQLERFLGDRGCA